MRCYIMSRSWFFRLEKAKIRIQALVRSRVGDLKLTHVGGCFGWSYPLTHRYRFCAAIEDSFESSWKVRVSASKARSRFLLSFSKKIGRKKVRCSCSEDSSKSGREAINLSQKTNANLVFQHEQKVEVCSLKCWRRVWWRHLSREAEFRIHYGSRFAWCQVFDRSQSPVANQLNFH